MDQTVGNSPSVSVGWIPATVISHTHNNAVVECSVELIRYHHVFLTGSLILMY